MKTTQEKTVQIRVKFQDRTLARPVLENLGRDRALSVNILRGRITQEDASFELQVTGPVQRVDSFIRLSDTWGASVGPSFMSVA